MAGTFKSPTAEEPAPKPDVIPGDEVFFNHPSGPMSGCVVACGRHGATIQAGNTTHKIKWPHILGHKRRAPQNYQIEDSGEDGHLMRDASGRRRFVAVPNEAREDPLMVKADGGKGPFTSTTKNSGSKFSGRPGLQKKVITERTGKQNTHWVRTGQDQPKERQPAQSDEGGDAPKPTAKVGDKVKFSAGTFEGEGTVVAAGRDGAHVRDAKGRDHPVHWHEINQRPNYAPRNEGENDKSYAKRVVDHMPSPSHLPEDHDKYFHTDGASTVPIENLHSTKSDEENKQGGENGPKRMQAAYHGVLGKRDPITVAPHPEKGDGHFKVLDGNGTYTSAKNAGWKHMPVNIVKEEDYKAKELAKEVIDPAKFKDLPKKAEQPVNTQEELIDLAKEGLQDLKEWLNEGKGVASAAGFTKPPKGPDDMKPEDWAKPGGLLFIAKNKTDSQKGLARAQQKVDGYGGNWNRLTDIVRCTLAVDNLDDMADIMQRLRASGMKIAQQPKNKFLNPTKEGYADINLVCTMKNGCQAEVQLNVKDMLRAKNEAHHYYDVTRKILADRGIEDSPEEEWNIRDWSADEWKQFKDAFNKQCRIYGDAWLKHIETHYGSKEEAAGAAARAHGSPESGKKDATMAKSSRRVVFMKGSDDALQGI